jgi:nucleotide-binding universal stress UspA family protein
MAVGERKTNSARKTGSASTADRLEFLRDTLCGVDGTRTAYEAVRQAASLAEPGGQLTLLAVTGPGGSGHRRNAINQAVFGPERARRALDYARRIAGQNRVRVRAEVEQRGPIGQVLLERASEHALLALGAPAMSRHAHILIGGVTSTAAHKLPVSLLVARRPPTGVELTARMIIASDALSGSDRLLDLALQLARRRHADLLLLHAAGAESRFQPTRIARQAERVADALGPRGRLYVAPGRANKVILESAVRERASLIVLSSRRVGGLRALGSVSERVVHHAPCSVLVVHPEHLSG